MLAFLALILGAQAADADTVERLRVWTTLYGTVRFFHPSDELAAADLDALACAGARIARDASGPDALAAGLGDLLAPLAPTVQVWTGEPPAPPAPPRGSSRRTVAWTHLGVGLGDQTGAYRSVRTRRSIEVPRGRRGGHMSQRVDATPLRGGEVRLTGRVASDHERGASIWLRVDSDERNALAFENLATDPVIGDYQTRSITLPVAEEATRVVFGGLAFGDDGRFDDLRLEARDGDDWRPVPIANGHFAQGESHWSHATDDAYTLTFPKADGDRIATLTRRTAERGPPFQSRLSYPTDHETPLGLGVHARVPLVLLDKQGRTQPLGGPVPSLPTCDDPTDEDTRIASVALLWSVMQHFYPYWEVVDAPDAPLDRAGLPDDWDAALTAALHGALDAEDPVDHLHVLERLVAALHDGHGRVWLQRHDPGWVPARVLPVDDGLVVLESQVDGLSAGDVITRVGAETVAERTAEANLRRSGSPQFRRLRAAIEALSGELDAETTLTLDDGRTVPATFDEWTRWDPAEPPVRTLPDGIVVVDLTEAEWDHLEPRLPDLANAVGIVFDVRGYPTGAAMDLLPHLLSEPDTDEWMSIPRIQRPDRADPVGWATFGWNVQPREPHIGVPTAWLTDASAISYAESIMAFVPAYDLGPIFGGPTAGANGNVNPFRLPGGYRVSWTGMRVLTHAGEPQHLRGVPPTHPVAPTVEGIRAGRDEVLEAALAHLRGG